MTKIYSDLATLIGKTPLLELSRYTKLNNINASIAAKLEYFNPTGSVKDRAALYMLNAAQKAGFVNKDTVIIEPTSGNTGIGLASIAAVRGLRIILTMPETMSIERRNLLKAYGAEIVLTDGKKGMNGAIEKAESLNKEIINSYILGQFSNPNNALAHYETTGVEIWNDTDGKVDAFVCGIGTGGTITGVGKYLKEKNPKIKIIGVEPKSSPFLTEGISGAHKIQGIGAGFVPKILDTTIYDEIIAVENDDAFLAAKSVAKTDGTLVGISSGAALHAAKIIAKRQEFKNKLIVVLFPDTGERYLSTPLFLE